MRRRRRKLAEQVERRFGAALGYCSLRGGTVGGVVEYYDAQARAVSVKRLEDKLTILLFDKDTSTTYESRKQHGSVGKQGREDCNYECGTKNEGHDYSEIENILR